MMRRDVLLVAAGAVVGALGRYYAGMAFAALFGTAFPAATFIINVTGSIGLGILLTVLAERPRINPAWRLFGGTGFFGAYTTFSTYSSDGLTLARTGAIVTFSLYWLGSLLCGLAGVALGVYATRALFRRPVADPDVGN